MGLFSLRPKVVYATGVVVITGSSCSALVWHAPIVPVSSCSSSTASSHWTRAAASRPVRPRQDRFLCSGGRLPTDFCCWSSNEGHDAMGGFRDVHAQQDRRQESRHTLRMSSSATSNSQKRQPWWSGDWIDSGKKLLAGIALASTLLGSGTMLSPGTAGIANAAQDTKAVGMCLLSNCRAELASCILNPKCLANVICLNTCNNRADESYCQIRCGDLFENDAVGKFNACAVSKKKCVKQRQDDGSWPVPPVESMVKSFDTKMMEGRWFISAGLNPAFDCFDCQVHFFNSPKPGKIVGKLNWRITEPDGEFFNRDVVQKFIQDPKNPAHLVNKDNEYLHYRDDWYILDAEKDSHVLVLYRGSNDAWDGYGGGTLYTRSRTVPEDLVERMREKCKAAGIDWNQFQYTDNTCKLQDRETSERLREKYAKQLLLTGEEKLQEQLTAARGFAAQEVEGVESSALEALDNLRYEYQEVENSVLEEAEKLEIDLVKAFEAELTVFERTLSLEAEDLKTQATRAEQITEDALVGGQFNTREANVALGRLEKKMLEE